MDLQTIVDAIVKLHQCPLYSTQNCKCISGGDFFVVGIVCGAMKSTPYNARGTYTPDEEYSLRCNCGVMKILWCYEEYSLQCKEYS